MLTLYRLIAALALPWLLALSWARGEAWRERLGLGPAPRPGAEAAPRLWLHGASVGELTSARWVLAGLVAARPGLQVLVSCNTMTARAMVRGWALPGVQAGLAPFDAPGLPGRVLARWQPRALVVVEGEFWPERLAAAARRGLPVLLIGARISARSARRWARAAALIGPALGRVAWASAQDAQSRERLIALGLPAERLGAEVDLKAHAAAVAVAAKPGPGPGPAPAPAPRDRVLLAASTHPGEEEIVLRAFAGQGQFSHLILAPRHPARGDGLARLVAAQGLGLARRSEGELPRADRPVFLADSLGEMGLWYPLAGLCLVGGSWVDRGGHTPFEPGSHGCALAHGPSTDNFAAVFAALDAQGGALAPNAAELAGALASCDAAAQADLVARAAPILARRGDGSALVATILEMARL